MSKFVIVFLETTFLPVLCYHVHCEPKIFFSVFRSMHLPLDTQFLTRGFPLVMRSRKADLPLATRARKRELCLYRYVSRTTRTENFTSQFFFRSFFWRPLFSPFYVTLFIVSRKYFFGFSKSARTPRYTILDSRLPPCNAISEGRPPLCNTSSEAGALPLSRMTQTENFLCQNLL